MDILPSQVNNEVAPSITQSVAASAMTPKPKIRTKFIVPREKETEVFGNIVLAHTKKPESKRMKRRLQEFQHENEILAKAISEKNIEISALKRSVDSLNEVLNSVPIDELRCNSSIASTKILELSKKNRQLRAELEQMKNRMTKKDRQIDKLERDLKSSEDKALQSVETIKKSTHGDEVHGKLSSMQQKLFETRNKNVELQNQLKMAQKCLQQEVGESFNMSQMITHAGTQSNWRGRAQQILTLQQKVGELRQRLEAYEERMSVRSEYGIGPGAPPGTEIDLKDPQLADNTTTILFDRFTPGVRKSEILHRAKVETLEKEITDLKEHIEDHRGKILALKVRNKTLNDEMLKYKLKTSVLEEQTDYNGVNIQTMNEKLNKQRHQYECRLEDLRSDLSKMTAERDEVRRQKQELNGKKIDAEESLMAKEQYIKQIEDAMQKLDTDLRALSGGFLFSCREFRKEEFVSILDALEVDKNQLLIHNKNLSDRLDAERMKTEAFSEQTTKQKIRMSRLEAKIRDLEKELEVQTERKKRTQRMSDYANSISRTSLSGSLASFNFDNSSIFSMATGPMCTEETLQAKVDDLKNQLELGNEKVAMLTEKLDYLTEEKNNDAKFFEDAMINSKSIILETILSHQREQNNKSMTVEEDKFPSDGPTRVLI